MFGRIKDFRGIATRYDRLAQNFLATVYLVATICYWLSVRSLVFSIQSMQKHPQSVGQHVSDDSVPIRTPMHPIVQV